MIALVAGALALVAGAAFFMKREEFIQARMVDRRLRRGGFWISGLRPLTRRNAVVAAWGAIMLRVVAAALMFVAGIRDIMI